MEVAHSEEDMQSMQWARWKSINGQMFHTADKHLSLLYMKLYFCNSVTKDITLWVIYKLYFTSEYQLEKYISQNNIIF